MKSHVYGPKPAFSLLELLVVSAIIGIVLGFSVPAFESISNSNKLTSSAQLLVGELVLARGHAIASNQPVEVRLYEMNGSKGALVYRALQTYAADGVTPLGPVVLLPPPICMSGDAVTNSFLSLEEVAADPKSVPLEIAGSKFRRFQFRPNGATDLDSSGKWFVSLQSELGPFGGPAGLSKNFITIQLDPVSGRIRTYRP